MNVRLPPQLIRKAKVLAHLEGITLEQWVANLILDQDSPVEIDFTIMPLKP